MCEFLHSYETRNIEQTIQKIKISERKRLIIMDNKAIETLSVNAVKNSIVASDFLDHFINDNDKEPFWDGTIYIYDNKSKKK